MDQIYHNTTGESFTIDEVVERLHMYYQEDPESEYRIIIGSDSQRFQGPKTVTYTSVVLMHRVGKAAIFFFLKRKEPYAKYIGLHERITNEVTYSLELVKHIENSIVMQEIGQNNMEVHIDAGPNGKSREILAAVIGYVKGNGYECKTKPDAYVASKVADRFSKAS
jgi:predicted RNase H-related nuclease YkuK (DUF458 family)